MCDSKLAEVNIKPKAIYLFDRDHGHLGGITIVYWFSDLNVIQYGVARCRMGDMFSKKKGYANAMKNGLGHVMAGGIPLYGTIDLTDRVWCLAAINADPSIEMKPVDCYEHLPRKIIQTIVQMAYGLELPEHLAEYVRMDEDDVEAAYFYHMLFDAELREEEAALRLRNYLPKENNCYFDEYEDD